MRISVGNQLAISQLTPHDALKTIIGSGTTSIVIAAQTQPEVSTLAGRRKLMQSFLLRNRWSRKTNKVGSYMSDSGAAHGTVQ